jgi:Putative citrate transport/LysM domain
MGPLAKTLMAISLGAVFMGANTYIGNAPNFMVYAIARRAGVNMPTFFPYMVWSGTVLLPVFAAVTWLFLRVPGVVPSVSVATVQKQIPAAEKAPETKFYTVRPGDTLWKIAETEYGHGSKYNKIVEANKPLLSNPGKIRPGQVLRIPPLQD